jgi:hypothetical protein
MNSVKFIERVERKGVVLSPAVKKILDLQLKNMGLTRDMLTPKIAEEYIARVSSAASFVIGPEAGMALKRLMYRELREEAPEHFASMGLL